MQAKNSKFSGYLLIAVFVVPLLIAIAMYSLRGHLSVVKPAAHGQLIHPAQPIEEFAVAFTTGNSSDLKFLKSKWTYLFYAPGKCNLECEAALFKLRQTKTAAGRESSRIQSIIIVDTPHINKQILARYEKIKAAQLLKMQLENQNQLTLEPGAIYLIDPNANIMMKYDYSATSRGLLKDIKKLLKISNIG